MVLRPPFARRVGDVRSPAASATMERVDLSAADARPRRIVGARIGTSLALFLENSRQRTLSSTLAVAGSTWRTLVFSADEGAARQTNSPASCGRARVWGRVGSKDPLAGHAVQAGGQ